MATFGSQADFARAHGWAKSYVTALKKEGRIVFNDAGQVDFDASLERIKATTGAPERAAAPVQGKAYSDAQDRERFYTSELKRLEYEKAVGKLLEADQVAAVHADAAATFRAAVEAWEHRLTPQLAALGGDEQRIAALLRSEGAQLLKRLSEKFAALAQRGEGAAS